MSCNNRRRLLGDLKNIVDGMDNKCCKPCCCPIPGFVLPQPACCNKCCQQPCCCEKKPCMIPQIEIYDPCPKPCIPVGKPCPCPGPAPCVANPCDPCGGVPYIPIVIPPQQPYIPICDDCGNSEQPCVPCNPPPMMVAYRRTCCLKRCKSRELRASILYTGCDCCKRNGLQDDCPRSDCHNNPDCLTYPDPCCSCSGMMKEEYQCYPAYFKLPCCCPPDCKCSKCCPKKCCEPKCCESKCCEPKCCCYGPPPIMPIPPCPPTACPGPSPTVAVQIPTCCPCPPPPPPMVPVCPTCCCC